MDSFRQLRRGATPLLVGLMVGLMVGCSTTDRTGRDGPPEQDRFLGTIYDAIPRDEPIREANSRPYTVRGQHYTPLASAIDYKATGIASWYGTKFHDRKTATGETYDMWAMTAAHRTLPLPSYVRVRNIHNGRTVDVRVNDRGPFIDNRVIDLSYAAAKKLDIVASGTGTVTVTGIDASQYPPEDNANSSNDGKDGAETLLTNPENTFSFDGATNQWQESGNGVAGEITNNQQYLVQVGAYSDPVNARAMRVKLQQLKYPLYPINEEIQYANAPFRVRVGPYLSRVLAVKAQTLLQRTLGIKPIVVRLQ